MELKNLQDIFNNRIFRIPDYQRGYSWGGKQLDDLWRDIDILEDDNIHYTGLLSVDSKNNKEIIHIVDGQQRLTTLVILIHVICKCKQLESQEWMNHIEKCDYVKTYLHRETGAQEKNVKMIFGYEKDNPSHIHFKTKILGLHDSEKSVAEHTLYTNNLDNAKEFFEKNIKGLDSAQLEKLLKKITTQFQFLYYQLDEKLNQFVTFETMNYRGKSLTTLELLKNRLMYLSTELPGHSDDEKSSLRTDINNAWKTIYEYLGKDPKKTLDDDDFLNAHWIMYFNEYSRTASKIFARFLLDKHFTVARVSAEEITYDDIQRYVRDIQKVVCAWYHLHNPNVSNYPSDIKIWLGKLNRLNFRSFRPLVASLLSNMDEIGEEKVLQLLKIAERFNFVVLEINMGGNNANYKTVPIYKGTHMAHENPEKFNSTEFDFKNLKVHSNSFVFSKEKFREKIWNNNQNTGFYGWKSAARLRYFLYEYELHLQQKHGHKETKLHWEQVNVETIEHIYPQNPEPKGWSAFESEESQYLLHELGNLMLFSLSGNSGLGNRPFEEKKKKYKNGSYSAIEVASANDWTPDSIQTRQEKMLAFLWKRWDLETPSENT